VVLVGAPWWTRPGLEPRDGRLTIAGEDAEQLARAHGTPLFAYDLDRFADNARRIAAALDATGLDVRLRFALKANPEPRILEVLRPLVGIDACSPGEVIRALECGWRPEEKVTREQAWWAFTRGGAYAGFAEEKFGRLAPGQLADFIIVDRDPMLASPSDLRQTKVEETWIGGVKIYVRKAG